MAGAQPTAFLGLADGELLSAHVWKQPGADVRAAVVNTTLNRAPSRPGGRTGGTSVAIAHLGPEHLSVGPAPWQKNSVRAQSTGLHALVRAVGSDGILGRCAVRPKEATRIMQAQHAQHIGSDIETQ